MRMAMRCFALPVRGLPTRQPGQCRLFKLWVNSPERAEDNSRGQRPRLRCKTSDPERVEHPVRPLQGRTANHKKPGALPPAVLLIPCGDGSEVIPVK
jgi:hypothetical protein